MDAGHLQLSLRESGLTALRLGPRQASPDPNVLLEEDLSGVPVDPLNPAGPKLWVPGQEHPVSLRFDPAPNAEKVWLLVRDRNVVDLVDRLRGAPEPRQYLDVSTHPRLAAFSVALAGGPWVVVASADDANGIADDGTVVNEIGVYTDGTLMLPPQDLPECAFGACCQGYTCLEHLSERTCLYLGGRWKGDKTACGEVRCCPDPFADTDADGDVDMTDFARWQRCFTADGDAAIAAGCACFDRDENGRIDALADFSAFAACARGPGVAADPTCDGNGN